MKKALFILTILVCSCKATQENIAFDQKLDLCYKAKAEQRNRFMAVPSDSLFIYENFLSAMENELLLRRTLNKIDKKSYKALFSKIKTDETKKVIVEDLKIGSEQEKRTIDTIYQDLGCFSTLVQLQKLVAENDFRYKMNKIGEKLLMDSYNYELINQLIDIIPEKEFQKIEYRRMLLRLIYNHLTMEKIQ